MDPKPNTANTAKQFKAAWQQSIEQELRAELHTMAKKSLDKLFQEMNKKVLEVVANVQARLIMNDAFDQYHGAVTVQLLLPKEMTENPPDGGPV